MKTETLLEVVRTDGKLDVDAEKGVIRGVKVIGHESANGRTYMPEALRKAKGLYEGIAVNIDHPAKSSDMRSFGSRFGWLEGISERSDGLYGDLHFLKADQYAPKVIETATRRPQLFGLSHNAEGKTTRRGGKVLVEEIVSVRSVDLVSDPATTRGLFEGKGKIMPDILTKTLSVKQIMEATKKDSWEKRSLTAILEQDGEMAAMPVEVAPDASTDDQVKAAFRSMVVAAFDDESLDAKATLKKISEILKAQEKLMSSGEAPKKESKPAEPAAEGKQPTVDQRVAQLEEQLAKSAKENAVHKLLEAADAAAKPEHFAALCALPDEASRKAMVDLLPKRAAVAESARPRSGAPLQTAGGGKTKTDAKSFLEAVTAR